ncbi:hypothetical protein BC629DRAFT_1471175, partial [Irpex lacteus]
MSNPAIQEEQLLELMLQLRKTTPEQARAILNAQPQIAYALMAVMVNINAVKVDVIQKTVADFTANASAAAQAVPPPAPTPVAHAPVAPVRPPSNIPPPSRGPPPPGFARHGTPSGPPVPPPYYGQPGPSYHQPTPPPVHNPYAAAGGPPPGYGGPPGPPPGYQLPPAFANIPEEQKVLLMNVIAMTPEDIYRRPPQERANLIQLRQTLGLP